MVRAGAVSQLRRVEELTDALDAKPLNHQAANALMRQLFAGVVVDWTRGALSLQWKQGGATELAM
jgi:hypothetical protein